MRGGGGSGPRCVVAGVTARPDNGVAACSGVWLWLTDARATRLPHDAIVVHSPGV